ncbi:MAG: dihydrofolate reductase DfrA [Flammeovirgaceae bacterium]
MSVKITLIAAVSKNLAIGKNNQLLWRLPKDMKFFKQTTLHHAVIMGRKTFESLGGKPLTDRLNIVLTFNNDFKPTGVEVAHSLENALKAAQKINKNEVFVIGGGEIYKLFLPLSQRIYLTEVNVEIEGDTYFPDFQKNQWKEVSRIHHNKDEKHIYDFDIVCYEKN